MGQKHRIDKIHHEDCQKCVCEEDEDKEDHNDQVNFAVIRAAQGTFWKNKIILKVKNKSGFVDTYVYSSSVPDSFYQKEKGVVRATNLFCKPKF